MKIIKYLFFLILIIAAGTAAYIALLDNQFKLEEQIELNAPRELVFEQVSNLKKWDSWSAISSNTAGMSVDTTLGRHHLSWKNDSTGTAGRLKITQTRHYSSLRQEARTKSSVGTINYQINWRFDRNNDSTTVSVKIKGNLDFWATAKRLFTRDSIAPQLSIRLTHDLNSLKESVLKKMRVYSIAVLGTGTSETKTYLYSTFATRNKPEIIRRKREKTINHLNHFLQTHHIDKKGAPFMVFNSIDRRHGNIIASIGIPVSPNTTVADPKSEVLVGTLTGSTIVKSVLKGDYDNIPKLWEATKMYMRKHQLTQLEQRPAYEVFTVTERDSKNPANWVTLLYVPVKKSALN